MSDEVSLYECEAPGFTLTLFNDRIEVLARRRLQTIPLSEIVEVRITARPKKLEVVTSASKHYQYLLGRDTEPARAAIQSQMRLMQPATPPEPRA